MAKPVFLITPTVDMAKQQKQAQALDLELVDQWTANTPFLHLVDGALTLSVCTPGSASPLSVFVDFITFRHTLKPAGNKQRLLLRAVKTRQSDHVSILDATGGLGRDSFLLAQAGHDVIVLEQNRIVFALLADGLERGMRQEQTRETCRRMACHCCEAAAYILQRQPRVEVIYLDPMFPKRGKSGKAKQQLQVLQYLLPHRDNDCRLLSSAWAVRPQKIVVKRPLKGPHLCHLAPEYTLRGKTIRYDVYTPVSRKNPFSTDQIPIR
ncbi:MAG: hypothetical protein CSA33_06125 [Desulfobulbus propionicus]|nr:MAG: hypothetical protein CSA33_06125 [Desulfobulbus propionicus]